MSRVNLTAWQPHRLRLQLKETLDARLWRRTLAVLEFDQGRTAADIAHMLGVTRQSVYNWVGAYAQGHDPRRCATSKGRVALGRWTKTTSICWGALLDLSPKDLGCPHVSWTIPLLQEFLEVATGRRVSDDTLRRS